LWDMHVHGTAIRHFSELYIANGVTGVRDMFSPMDRIDSERNSIRSGKPGPRIVAAGRILDGPKPYWPGSASAKDAEEARKAVGTLKEEGSDFIKVYSLLPRDAFFAIADETKRRGMVFAGHVPELVSAAEASDAGQRSIEHMTGVLLACSSQEAELRQQRLDALAKKDFATYSETDVRALSTYDPAKAHHLFVELTDNNTWQVPTLVWDRADAHIGDPDPPDELKYVPASLRKQWDPNKLLSATSPEEMAARKKLALRYIELAGEMHRAGVPFMAGSDSPDPYVIPGFSLHEELELLVQAGFSNAEALQTATFRPALFLAKLDHYGVIEKGREADMVLLDANPLENIHNSRKIAAVIVRGKYFPRADLDKILMGIEEAAAKE